MFHRYIQMFIKSSKKTYIYIYTSKYISSVAILAQVELAIPLESKLKPFGQASAVRLKLALQ